LPRARGAWVKIDSCWKFLGFFQVVVRRRTRTTPDRINRIDRMKGRFIRCILFILSGPSRDRLRNMSERTCRCWSNVSLDAESETNPLRCPPLDCPSLA
jgi:hypothetical protein